MHIRLLPFLLCVGCGASAIDGSAMDGAADSAPADSTPAETAVRDALPVIQDATAVDAVLSDRVDASEDVPVIIHPPGVIHVTGLAVTTILHQCAVLSDGTVRCRGLSSEGQLGIGPTSETYVTTPTTVPGLNDVVHVVTTSASTTCARLRNGTVQCWGSNRDGMLGTGHLGDETCASFSRSVPCRTRPTLVQGLDHVVQLEPSDFSTCAVRDDGSVWCWGYLSLLLPESSPVPVRVPQLSDVVALWNKNVDWIARTRSGEYRTVGFDFPSVPAEAEIAEGNASSHLCYRLPDATVRCLGLNADGKVGNGTSLWPGRVTDPVDPGLRDVRSIVTGGYHTCVVMHDRTVQCWGDGYSGGVGVEPRERCAGISNPTDCVTRPTPVTGIDQVDRIFLGIWGSCALRTDHSVWCWGNLSPERSSTPTPVAW